MRRRFVSHARRSRRPGGRPGRGLRQAGMSLIEIMIVLAISSLMIGMVLYSANSGRAAEVTRATNQLANTFRFTFNKARISGTYFRININIDDREFSVQQADEAMYMPATDRNGEPVVLTESEIEDRAARDKRAEDNYNRSVIAKILDAEASASDDDVEIDPYGATVRKVPRQKPPVFSAFDDDNALSEVKKPFKLPKELEIVSIRTEHDPKPVKKGEANLFFFPQGRTQKTHIQLRKKGAKATDEGQVFTIIVHPLTGRVDIKEGLVELKLPTDERDKEDDTGRRRTRRSF